MPIGTAMTVARAVISIVPTTAGPIPPTFGGPTWGWVEPGRKDQLMIEAPLAITVKMTNPSGMIMSTNASTIRAVAMPLLLRRRPVGSRRSGFRCPVAMVIRHPASAGRSAPRAPPLPQTRGPTPAEGLADLVRDARGLFVAGGERV